MGSVFSIDLILFYILIFSKPQMPPRRDNGFSFPSELTQLIHQQNALMQMLVQNQNRGNNNNNPPEITTLVEKNDDLKKKLKIFMGFPAIGGEDEDCTCPKNYIIIGDTDSDPDDSDDDFVDGARADIMESSTNQFF